MLIHGKLILTQNGFMLDEVKSLLQKALRRKERGLIASSAKELSGKSFDETDAFESRDQLQWKALVNYLFEDHCLSGTEVLKRFYTCFQRKDKLAAVELLAECFTCRVAACLPVIAINEEYDPSNVWDKESVDATDIAEWSGIAVSGSDELDFDSILKHLKVSWKKKDVQGLITCMKLCSMVIDIDKAHVRKGKEKLLLSHEKKKPNLGHVIVTFLYRLSEDRYWKEYLKACFALLDIPDVCIRLVLFTIVAHVQFKDKVKSVDISKVEKIGWEKVQKLTIMPSWAVDKHTFRGKFGKYTSHLLSKKRPNMREPEELEEFHGVRPKVDIKHFFDEGAFCRNETLGDDGNPYWEDTKKCYYDRPTKVQKTAKMAVVYYNDLKGRCEFLFKKKTSSPNTDVGSKVQNVNLKRKGSALKAAGDEKPEIKKRKQKTEPSTSASLDVVRPKGPLLQLPTGSAKVYTWVDTASNKVWKGPYKKAKYNLTIFFHKALKDALGDVHTLEAKEQEPYITFPLLQGKDATLNVTKMDIYDCIAKQQIKDQEFVQRQDLGVIQLHRLDLSKIKELPYTIWLHFLYRFMFNIGDSGLYNAITDKELSFIYGIDMEENRISIKGASLLHLMFTKLPAKAYAAAIQEVLPSQKPDLRKAIEEIGESQVAKIKDLSVQYNVIFDSDMFLRRRKHIQNALK